MRARDAADLTAQLAPVFAAVFAPFRHVVLAVSGGSDSMALMHLAAAWRAQGGAAALSVVTIDHGLRPESGAEAAAVAGAAAGLGLSHTTLRWTGTKPSGGVQAAARAARLRLWRQHLDDHQYSAIATAHTADDQAETVLMRLARGSGVDGLAAMRAASPLAGDGAQLTLLRPLLSVPKAALTRYLIARCIAWCEDPSNRAARFERVRVRQARAGLATSGVNLTTEALARSAQRMARSSDALAQVTAAAWSAAGALARFDALAFATVNWGWLLAQPEDIRVRLLVGLITRVGGGNAPECDPVSLGRLEALTVNTRWQPPRGATLGGAALWVQQGDGADAAPAVVIAREWGRAGVWKRHALRPDRTELWDRRFSVVVGTACPGGLEVGPLGPEGLAAVRQARPRCPTVSARVAWTQPAVWRGDSLLAAPTLGFAQSSVAGMITCCALPPTFAARADYQTNGTSR